MESNLKVYNSKSILKWYNGLAEITCAEKIIFENYREFLSASSLLDIGIGGGRTTAYLIDKCNKYTGIDYSEEFTNYCAVRFQGTTILKQDARNLFLFANNSFDFINFSFNGIDYVDLSGRKKALSEIYRVLKPGGIFFFSTHNRNHPTFNQKPWLNKKNSLLTNIKTFIKLLPFGFRKIQNKNLEIFTTDYAVINDSAHNYNLITFYTSPSFLRSQLTDQNFKEIFFYSAKGEKVPDGKLDDWIFITCVKN